MPIHRLVNVTPLSPATEDYRKWLVASGDGGVTLIEVLIAVAIVGVLASISVPALLNARRYANQASAVASLHAIADAQHAFATSCGSGFFASRLPQLASPPPAGGEAFLSADLGSADRVAKSGYDIRLTAGSDGQPATLDACNGVSAANLTSSFVATASPESPASGALYYWVGVAGTVYVWSQPITSTLGQMNPPGAQPAGTDANRPDRRRGPGIERPAVP